MNIRRRQYRLSRNALSAGWPFAGLLLARRSRQNWRPGERHVHGFSEADLLQRRHFAGQRIGLRILDVEGHGTFLEIVDPYTSSRIYEAKGAG
ncbi:hypothetical protein ABIF65_011979 [Bradyrhizobium japonicum]|jgi:hypothetical protein|nr:MULTISPECIES: hypothetical protein [Bradyrhizobium]MCP1748603.1 hypothetical protein [Bradyrhizobium japonicum]MCP1769079.1 hypothetical protein [Bradyrhizobium japonicum]MCP1784785.1 hypothetical protein [Bradyrhizobium japonicum]MCP1794738.1 hypothetical protein [Bradyrhizobium japonicum]MCP1810857.1 hypothetical protein [Bradyrhizobium japonicum]